MDADREDPKRPGILPQHAHLSGMAQCMPIIRKLLGLPEHGRLPDTSIGRALQRIVDNDRENDVR